MALATTQEIIEDIRQGKMVILMDDEDRENEGDLIIAAEKVTPEAVNFMAKYGRGLICLTLTEQRCQQLNLPLMVDNNGAQFSTNFTVSIEAAEGVTTGISAADRATTILAAVNKDAKPSDIVQPGHIFPLKAQNGGVLMRAGHTEAGCDLPRLAGLEPTSVIVEILNEDGTMARRSDLEKFAQQHNLKMGTIADLIEYRNTVETTIVKEAQCKLPTRFGDFEMITYRDTIDNLLHFALVKGTLDDNPLVRVHVYNTFNDILGSLREGANSWSLQNAMTHIGENGGVVVILGSDADQESILTKIKQFAAEDEGQQGIKQNPQGASRRVGVGSQILADLGVHKMRLLGSDKKYRALGGFGLEVTEFIPE